MLDCVASGAMWVDMQATGRGRAHQRPAKGWSGSPCCAMVMLERTRAPGHRGHHEQQLRLRPEEVDADRRGLRKGQHAYHTTMPTDALVRLRDVMLRHAPTASQVREEQIELGAKVRALLEPRASPAWRPRASRPRRGGELHHRPRHPERPRSSLEVGLQTASGVPLQCDEGPDFKTFRIGLFGLEKWHNVDRTVGHHLTAALE